MLKTLTFLTLCVALVSGEQKEYNNEENYNNPLLNFNTGPQRTSQNVQGNYFKEPRVQKKPCPNRRSQNGNIPTAEEWVPTFHWKYVRPIAKTNYNSNVVTERNTLQSQSLKNEEAGNVNDKIYQVNTKKLLKCLDKSKIVTSYLEKNTNVADNDNISRRQQENDKHVDSSVSKQTNNISADSNDANDCLDDDDNLSSSEITNSRRSISDDTSLDVLDEFSTLKNNKEILESQKKVENISKPLLQNNDDAVNKHKKYFQTEDLADEHIEDYQDESRNGNSKELPLPEASQKQNNFEDRVKEPVARKFNPVEIEGQLMEPTIGKGVSELSASRVILMQNSRVCYACSSANDNTCWNPTRRTTVKYCRNGHDVCVTRTYKSQRTGLIVIRDCAESCDVKNTGLEIKFKSCSICKNDLCNSVYVDNNGSYSINSYNMILVLIVTCFVKYTS